MTYMPEIPGTPGRAPRDLRVRRETGEHAVVVRVAGEVDLANAGHLAQQLREARREAASGRLIADLAEVGFLGSSGLVVLVRELESCDRCGVSLRIVSSSRPVLRSITMSGLGEVLPVSPTMDEALAAVQSP
ncbi:anti-sigma factor antagonist [Amycolatopsis acidicola]|uniref:Anti-sigma factor antagonist n=2 Tax=Amycolatopsis acidicola TaxID=2596893 RepID=A0A5N0UWG7_9PSEU|nr:anti-sigma factor antagonist [Amycolatopsis acidicola]